MNTVACTTALPPAIQAELQSQFGARFVDSTVPGFAQSLQGVRAIIAAPACPLPAALIAALPPSVGLIAAYSAGTDYIDVAAARHRAIAVTNTPDVLTDATADAAMLLILSACRNASWAERHLRAGLWTGASLLDMFGVDLAGRTLGVLGFGRIGRAVARRALACGMRILYHSPRVGADDPTLPARFQPDFLEFLRTTDVLSLHAPLTPATRRIVDREALAQLRPGSILINTARGDLIDDDAVIDSLRRRHLRAAGFDVYSGEPRIHPGYLTLDNVTLLPHMGSAAAETRLAMGRKVIANIEAFLAGRTLPNPVLR